MEVLFWAALALIVVGFTWAAVRLVFSARGNGWRNAIVRLVFGLAVCFAGLLLSVAVLLFCAFAYTGSTTLPPVTSPSGKHWVQVSSFNGGATEPFRTKVVLDGTDVFRSEDAPYQIRFRWDGEAGLAILTPTWPGQTIDEGPDYFCSPGVQGVTIRCEGYPASDLSSKSK